MFTTGSGTETCGLRENYRCVEEGEGERPGELLGGGEGTLVDMGALSGSGDPLCEIRAEGTKWLDLRAPPALTSM